MAEKYILITGATGFIGSYVANNLLADKRYQIVAVVRGHGDYKNAKELEKKGAILAEGSFCDRAFIEHVFEKYSFDYVIHLAALRGAGTATKQDFYDVNVKGTEILLEASLQHKVKKFIFCSSVGVFGTIPEKVPANLGNPLNGDNEYHYSKIIAEKAVLRYIDMGLNAFIVRPTITYGQGDNGFPSTLVHLVRRKLICLTYKDVMIHLLDVESFAGILKKLIESEDIVKRIFIIADKDPVSLRELANQIYLHYNNRPYPFYLKLPDVVFRVMINIFRIIKSEKWVTRLLLISKNWHYDISQTVDELGYVPVKTEDSFIRHMCGEHKE
ncbi:MAG: NAD(P)-dependent oxidoreductase [Desulfatiglans sp.]|nr:NAD(P)-dependent oxidoreductase [Desulfatiglans sp.]